MAHYCEDPIMEIVMPGMTTGPTGDTIQMYGMPVIPNIQLPGLGAPFGYVFVERVQMYKPGFGGPRDEMVPYGASPSTKHGRTKFAFPPNGYADAAPGVKRRSIAQSKVVDTAR